MYTYTLDHLPPHREDAIRRQVERTGSIVVAEPLDAEDEGDCTDPLVLLDGEVAAFLDRKDAWTFELTRLHGSFEFGFDLDLEDRPF